MPATVLSAQGVVIKIDDDSATPVKTTISGVDTFSFGDGEATDIDTTTLESTAMEFSQGLQDFGAFTLNFKRRDPNDVGQIQLEGAKAAQETREVTVTLASGDIATFTCYVKSLSSQGGVNGILNGAANCKITGSVVWS